MKNHFLLLLAGMAYSLVMAAQQPTLPKTLPKNPSNPNQITPKNLRLMGDLTVTCGTISCRTRDGITTVTARINVSNTGGTTSGEIKLRGLVAPNAAMKPTTSKPPTRYHDDSGSLGSWKPCTNEPVIPAIAAGAYHAETIEFQIPAADATNEKYLFFSVLADYYKNFLESNENNNSSTPKSVLNAR